MAPQIALGPTSKRESFKLNLRRAQRSEGTKLLLGIAIFALPIPQQVILAPGVVPEV
jgi:hypothetical protein